MGALEETREHRAGTLYERVDEAIRSHKGELMSWMGPQAAVGELARRDEGIEVALLEIARQVQELASARPGGPAPLVEQIAEIRSHNRPLFVSTTARVAAEELARRNTELERAVRDLALEAERLTAERDA
jgi:hypothetical protein